MWLLQKPLSWLIKKCLARLEHSMNYPLDVQEKLLKQLIHKSRSTSFGSQFSFASIRQITDFRARVPIHTYEQFYPYIERVLKGEKNVFWPTTIRWVARSSGTTASSKFIPVSSEALKKGHYRAGKDMLAIYMSNYPNNQLAQGKSMGIGGSIYPNDLHFESGIRHGDVSAVLMKNLPFWVQHNRTPDLAIALMEQWEKKIEKLTQITAKENITAIAGVPTWMLLLLQRVIAFKKKHFIQEVWPKLELFVHGGISFKPYKSLFQSITSRDLHYLEVYNASEGFFALQDQVDSGDLLLLLNHGIFYEFLPIEEINNEYPKVMGLEEVVLDQVYALVISTNAGLWRYQIGDTIKFTSLSPFRIRIVGRTKHFINAFGEELVVENAEVAITKACQLTGAIISDYTAGPRYIKASRSGSHEWVIEFVKPPRDINYFIDTLDEVLQEKNTDYAAKRQQNMVLGKPIVHVASCGLFYRWLKKQKRLGAQQKVPRLANDRRYLDSILPMLSEVD